MCASEFDTASLALKNALLKACLTVDVFEGSRVSATLVGNEKGAGLGPLIERVDTYEPIDERT
jgi:hypothetical protein